jgi:hypothetical protein
MGREGRPGESGEFGRVLVPVAGGESDDNEEVDDLEVSIRSPNRETKPGHRRTELVAGLLCCTTSSAPAFRVSPRSATTPVTTDRVYWVPTRQNGTE